jgi:hypothetical protein
MEIRGCLGDVKDTDVLRQLRVQRARDRVDGMREVDVDACHLAERVNAGIRAPAP